MRPQTATKDHSNAPERPHPHLRLVELPAHPPHGCHRAVQVRAVLHGHVLDGLLHEALLLPYPLVRRDVAEADLVPPPVAAEGRPAVGYLGPDDVDDAVGAL